MAVNTQEIEDAARELQLEIWAQKKVLWPEREPHPFDALAEVSLHRDFPIPGLERNAREPREREADHFAACFLMPTRLLTHLFHDMFLTRGEAFVFNELTLYNLGTNDADALLFPDVNSYDRETTLARTRVFGRRRFEKSLAEMFQVSTATMAIRIRELGLIRAWP